MFPVGIGEALARLTPDQRVSIAISVRFKGNAFLHVLELFLWESYTLSDLERYYHNVLGKRGMVSSKYRAEFKYGMEFLSKSFPLGKW